MFRSLVLIISVILGVGVSTAQTNRITRPLDKGRTRIISGTQHRLAQSRFETAAVDADMPMSYMQIMFKPSVSQQADLDQLLLDQQNPSSPLFHKWLSPELFADRFGLSRGDISRVTAW